MQRMIAVSKAELDWWSREVVEASRQLPVVVDFWAEWCAPCRYMAPVLEKVAREAQGRWKLVKVNVDNMPGIAQMEGVRGIPTLKVFVGGRAVAVQTGAMDESTLRRWLESVIPSAGQNVAKILIEKWGEGTLDRTYLPEIEAQLRSNEQEPVWKFLKAVVILRDQPEEAFALLSDIDESFSYYPQVEALRVLAQLLTGKALLPANGKVKELTEKAVAHMRAGEWDAAIGCIIEGLMENKNWGDGILRRLGIALFALRGEKSEFARRWRPRFNMLIF